MIVQECVSKKLGVIESFNFSKIIFLLTVITDPELVDESQAYQWHIVACKRSGWSVSIPSCRQAATMHQLQTACEKYPAYGQYDQRIHPSHCPGMTGWIHATCLHWSNAACRWLWVMPAPTTSSRRRAVFQADHLSRRRRVDAHITTSRAFRCRGDVGAWWWKGNRRSSRSDRRGFQHSVWIRNRRRRYSKTWRSWRLFLHWWPRGGSGREKECLGWVRSLLPNRSLEPDWEPFHIDLWKMFTTLVEATK